MAYPSKYLASRITPTLFTYAAINEQTVSSEGEIHRSGTRGWKRVTVNMIYPNSYRELEC